MTTTTFVALVTLSDPKSDYLGMSKAKLFHTRFAA